jgi:hypothetical protein
MQKQYVIWHTAPAVEIALQLAHRQFVVETLSPQRRRTSPSLAQEFRPGTGAEVFKFPFAMIAFVVLAVGLIMLASATVAASVWPTVTGFLVALCGTLLHGWSLCGERR